MNLERTKPETLAAGVMDYMPQSLAAHEYAERLNAALARLGLTERLTLPPAPNTAIDELPAVVDVPLRKTLSVLMGKAQQGDASALATLEMAAQVAESIFAGLHARDFAGDRPLALPSHESLATLSQGVDALLPRKISNGAWSLLADGTPSDGIDDGVSLVRLLCSDAADSVTELKDDSEGWVMTKALPSLPNLEKVQLNCVRATSNTGIPATAKSVIFPYLEDYDRGILMVCDGDGELSFPMLKHIRACDSNTNSINLKKAKKLVMPSLVNVESIGNTTFCTGAELEEIEWKSFVGYGPQTWGGWAILIGGCPNLKKVVFGKLQYSLKQSNANTSILSLGDNCIHLEFGQGTAVSLMLDTWNPTSVLSDSERLPIFLSNFKTYIAERLSEQGSGKTLTLSQAVRDAIQQDPEIVTIITSKGWSISPAPSV